MRRTSFLEMRLHEWANVLRRCFGANPCSPQTADLLSTNPPTYVTGMHDAKSTALSPLAILSTAECAPPCQLPSAYDLAATQRARPACAHYPGCGTQPAPREQRTE